MIEERIREIAKAPNQVRELWQDEEKELLERAQRLLQGEAKLVELPPLGKVVFVGDTHGDFDATMTICRRYLLEGYRLVFLGDYVDRGENSRANINYLLCLKLAHPGDIFLLQGNHEGYAVHRFHPADFWKALDEEMCQLYGRALLSLPLAFSINGIIALHGALPDVEALQEINQVQPASEQWRQITWGDWREREGDYLQEDSYSGRPQFGRWYFERLMRRLGKNVLIRSHQPDIPTVIYDRRCLTLFTSHAYRSTRTVAVTSMEREIKTADDLHLEPV